MDMAKTVTRMFNKTKNGMGKKNEASSTALPIRWGIIPVYTNIHKNGD